VIERYGDRFQVVSLSAWGNAELLRNQILRFQPKVACLMDEGDAERLKSDRALKKTKILWGTDGLLEVATGKDVDMVVSGIVGAAGLIPTFAAVEAGKDIALANKETLVAAGKLVMEEAAKKGCKVFPVDSEHSAIYQSLAGHRKEDVKRLILTASGGPFLSKEWGDLANVSAADALNHPTWEMGNKITIDSATMMNKGLEVIEARWLFDVPEKMIDVLIHPQSIIHSMVEYVDGSVLSQMGLPDMKGPIAYALSYPERLDLGSESLNLGAIGKLTFEEPDTKRFPSLALCYDALAKGGTTPAVISAANEIAVAAFLEENIRFTDIPTVMERVMMLHSPEEADRVSVVLQSDRWARKQAKEEVRNIMKMEAKSKCSQ
jgi:1-deoxy-D-xylulose-5-phosphate reductoisomerase